VAAGAGQASQMELLLIYGADPGAMDSSDKRLSITQSNYQLEISCSIDDLF